MGFGTSAIEVSSLMFKFFFYFPGLVIIVEWEGRWSDGCIGMVVCYFAYTKQFTSTIMNRKNGPKSDQIEQIEND